MEAAWRKMCLHRMLASIAAQQKNYFVCFGLYDSCRVLQITLPKVMSYIPFHAVVFPPLFLQNRMIAVLVSRLLSDQ